MAIPFQELVDFNDNVYCMTCAVIKRAVQITVTGDEELEEEGNKIVSLSLDQVLTKKVEYRLEA